MTADLVRPMLATAVTALPTGPGWSFEFKWDGVRVLADVAGGRVRLTSRLGNDVSGGYPELVDQLTGRGDLLLDGEVVAFVEGRPSFERLQTRMHVRGRSEVARAAAEAPVTYVLFDLLRHESTDLASVPYVERRALLESVVDPSWTLSPVLDDGPATEAVARAQGLEGVVAKRLASVYRPGARSDDWRKLRFVRSGEFAVVGWEAADAHPTTLSSLLLATVVDGSWRYAGKVGSGLTGRVAASIKAQLVPTGAPVTTEHPPRSPGRVARWVEPTLVVEVAYADRTGDGRLRHPVFRGVRADKSVEEATG